MAAAPLSENGDDDSTPTMDGITVGSKEVETSHASNGEWGCSVPLHEKNKDEHVSAQSSSTERIVQLKAKGNSLFVAQEYANAARVYKEGLDCLRMLSCKEQESIELEVALRANRAIVLLKTDSYSDAQEECIKALELDSTNAKVWYRLGLAREGLACAEKDDRVLDQAISDAQHCLTLFPSAPNPAQQKMINAATEALQRMQETKLRLQQPEVAPKPQCQESNTTTTASSRVGPPSPHQQRQDVIRLFMARQMQEKKNGNTEQGMPLDGEAFFLLNWSWWMAWCHYTDFFYMQNSTQVGKRQTGILKLLPPGSSIPIVDKKKKKRSLTSSEGGSDSDESDNESDDSQAMSGPPSAIDNSCLLVSDSTTTTLSPHRHYYQQWNPHLQNQHDETGDVCSLWLLPNLVRGYHYELLPREVYFALRVWYGEVTSSICRRVKVTTNPPKAVLSLYPEHAQPSKRRLGGFQCAACHRPNVKSRCTRCLSAHYCDRSCQESHWPFHKFACKKLAREQLQDPTAMEPQEQENVNWGRVGLNNLGNTCFMNSALQCLSHATPLTRLFLSNRFKADLNATNPLGTGGKLAHAYNIVMKDIWISQTKHGHASTSPTALKRAIAMFAPRFAGCSQHDAQEFLAYLLDGLHEDLNRIREAPYVEMPTVGSNMSIAGAEAWDAHRRRNDSLVMDTFYGQFKSTCVCPRCNRVSVSFDAFNHVSLEIPQFHNSTRTIPVLVIPSARGSSTNKTPTRYGVSVRRNEFVGDLKRALSELCDIPTTQMAICDVYEHAVYEILKDGTPLSAVRATDVLSAYEVDPYTNTTIHTIASNTCSALKAQPKTAEGEEEDEDEGHGLFGFPFVASFDADLSCKQVWDSLWNQVRLMIGNVGDPTLNGDTEDENGEYETYLRNLLQVRVVDNAGVPRPVFLDDDLSNMETMGVVDSASILPRASAEKLTKFLGKDCTERFLFVHLEWRDPRLPDGDGQDPSGHIPSFYSTDRFLCFEDHPTLVQGLQKQRAMMNGFKGVTIEQCFETFTRPERLDEHNMWYCSSCKDHVRAMKTMELWRLPNILVVHLKRFEFKHALRRDKLDTLVDFPLDGLDMSKHCASGSASFASGAESDSNGDAGDHQSSVFVVEDGAPAIYDLFAVTNHYGRMGFGHYTAFARKWNEEGMSKDWALFDDSSVRSVGDGLGGNDGQGVVTSAAYVLFYRRRIFN